MDTLSQIAGGFAVALDPQNLLFLLIGTFLGTIVGVLPGIGPVAGIALLIPLTFGLDPVGSLIMFAGIYYGSAYGGSITSILINTPGESATVMTTLDGYPMARKGRAGAALLIAALASFASGTFSIIALTLLAVPLTAVAIYFGPPEYFMLMLFAMSAVAILSGNSAVKGVLAAALGLAVTTIGIDLQTGLPRFTMGVQNLQEGIPFLIQVVGMFAIGEVLVNVENMIKGGVQPIRIQGPLWCTREEFRRSVMPTVRGGIIGFLVGVLPGAGQTIATIFAYAAEKRISKTPEKFGTGMVEGVAAPESANNSSALGSFVPMLALGVPGSATSAVLLGALMIYGIQPGPLLLSTRPDLVWGLVNSMYLGNIMLLILNVPLVGLFARIAYMPQGIMMAMILCISSISIYAISYSTFDLSMLLLFGIVGYGFRKLGIPFAPYVLAAVLGGMLEQSFRQSMTISNGSLSIFMGSGITVTFLLLTIFSIGMQLFFRRR